MKRFDLIGNRAIKQAAQKGDLGSAVIFDGVPGSGKKTAAAYAAAALLCRAPREGDRPCGVCASCRLLQAGNHPDVVWFNEAGENIKVRDVREWRMRSFVSPVQSPFKVFIINRADLMNQESQNALLKVLEEPQATVFLLLAENAASLLQTVRSRCRVYSMEALSPRDVLALLEEHYREAGKTIPRKELEAAAADCGGSAGRAMALCEKLDTKAAEAAKGFLTSLDGTALAVMEACLKASALSRAEAVDFYTEVTGGLARASVARPERARFYVAVYDKVQEQKDRLSDNNASVFALTSQLAAFCGTLMGELK